MEERIVELEVKLAYQDRMLADLNEVVRTFTSRVEELERKVAELKATILNPPEEMGPQDDPPPHY